MENNILNNKDQHLFDEFFDAIQATGHSHIQGEKNTGLGKLIHVENSGSTIMILILTNL